MICNMKSLLDRAASDLQVMIAKLTGLAGPLEKLGNAMLQCWQQRGKVLTAGNGGSAADAIHLAEELSVRFAKPRRALAAISLCDPGMLTCAANDMGYDSVFARQVEALGNPGDIFIGFSTSGNSSNILKAFAQAKSQNVMTVAFLGKDGGKAKGTCDIELIVPSPLTHRVQEGHQILYHTLCEWIDSKVS
jgi:D-sedoheptulose 7-phosphate isomerase